MDDSEAVLDERVLELSGESAEEKEFDSSSPFFVSKKAAAVLKHAILEQYVVPFAAKVGRYAPNGRVVYLDSYAGSGRYEDGTPGSPALILDSAARLAGVRQLDCYFVERGRKNYRALAALVEEANVSGLTAQALQGTAEKHLDYVLQRAVGQSLFAFLDPFGLGLSFQALTQQIFASRSARGTTGRYATEVLLNFNASAVRRIGGMLATSKDAANKRATLLALDATCGGTWWREEYLDSRDNAEAVQRIATGFARRVARTIRAAYWTIDVRNRAHHQVAYHLVHFSRHKDGFWLFGEAASRAQTAWRRACLPPPDDNALFGTVETFDEEEEDRARAWIARICQNIEDLQQRIGTFQIGNHQTEVLAGVLGQARGTHIRTAVKRLHQEGKTSCTGVGGSDARQLRITPPS